MTCMTPRAFADDTSALLKPLSCHAIAAASAPGAPCSLASWRTRSALRMPGVGTGAASGTTRTAGTGCEARSGAGAPLGHLEHGADLQQRRRVDAVDERHLGDADPGLGGERAERVARAHDVRAEHPRRPHRQRRDRLAVTATGAVAGRRRQRDGGRGRGGLGGHAGGRQRGRTLGHRGDLLSVLPSPIFASGAEAVVDGDAARREVALRRDPPQRLAGRDGVQHVGTGGRRGEQKGDRREDAELSGGASEDTEHASACGAFARSRASLRAPATAAAGPAAAAPIEAVSVKEQAAGSGHRLAAPDATHDARRAGARLRSRAAPGIHDPAPRSPHLVPWRFLSSWRA